MATGAFSAGAAPNWSPIRTGASDIHGTADQTGYEFDYGPQMQRAGRFERERLARARSGDTVAQQQLRQGLGQAQQAMAAQAGAQGANPLAQRAALYGGAQAQQQANLQAAQLQAQEQAAAEDAYSRWQQQAAQGHMGYDQMRLQQQMAEQQDYRAWNQQRMDQEKAARDFGMQMVGTAASAAAGAMSDRRAKMGAYGYSMSDERSKEGLSFASRGSTGGPMVAVIDTSQMSPEEAARAPGWEMRPSDIGRNAGLDRYLAQRGQNPYMAPVERSQARQPADASGLGQLFAKAAQAGGGAGYGASRNAYAGTYLSDRRGKAPPTMASPSQQDAAIASMSDRAAKMGAGSRDSEEEIRKRRLRASPLDYDRTARDMALYEYQYRPEMVAQGQPPGRQAGIMAQDLERTPLGETVVYRGPDGMRRVDTDRATLLNMGLMGRLGERADDTERRLRALERRSA